jgi:hypothetical protein
MSDNVTVYVSIGNSDDKLGQAEWAAFAATVRGAVHDWAAEIHGEWVSLPWSSYQNACWCIEVAGHSVDPLKRTLSAHAKKYRQNSIAWAPAVTEFITAAQ